MESSANLLIWKTYRVSVIAVIFITNSKWRTCVTMAAVPHLMYCVLLGLLLDTVRGAQSNMLAYQPTNFYSHEFAYNFTSFLQIFLAFHTRINRIIRSIGCYPCPLLFILLSNFSGTKGFFSYTSYEMSKQFSLSSALSTPPVTLPLKRCYSFERFVRFPSVAHLLRSALPRWPYAIRRLLKIASSWQYRMNMFL